MIFFAAKIVAFIFPLLLQCNPVSAVWDRSIDGHCINVTAIGYVGAGISITEDLIILALPLPTLWRLQISKTKRLVVAFMFSIGSL